jgi:tripartite-type tricarboxylate transporter receptor subunit TctC
MTKTNMQHIPYRGSAPALNDLLAGNVDLVFDNMTTVLPQVREGRLRALGVASLKRTPLAPDIPAIAETLPGFEATSWVGVVGPAGVPAPILNKLAAAFHAAMADPEVVTRLKALGATPETDTPAEFQQFILADRTKWIKLAKDAHIVQEK